MRATGRPVTPPTKLQLALMMWIAVFPTLTVLNLLFGGMLAGLPVILRTFILVTVAVPIVAYGAMPQLQRARVALSSRLRSEKARPDTPTSIQRTR